MICIEFSCMICMNLAVYTIKCKYYNNTYNALCIQRKKIIKTIKNKHFFTCL